MRWRGPRDGVMVYSPDASTDQPLVLEALVSRTRRVSADAGGDDDGVFEEHLYDVEEDDMTLSVETVYDCAIKAESDIEHELAPTRRSLLQPSMGLGVQDFEEPNDDGNDYDVIPSTETVYSCAIKEEPQDSTFERADSSATLAAALDLPTQLEDFARSPDRFTPTQPSSGWSSPVLVTPTSSSLDIGHISGSPETQASPSLRRNPVQTFEDDISCSPTSEFGHSTTPPVNRILDFGTPSGHLKKTTTVEHVSLKKLERIEKSPTHKWSEDERELLCFLYRYYKAADVHTIPMVFNSLRNLNLRHRTIQTQFGNLRLYGPKAYRSYRKVFSKPFNDNQGYYTKLHNIIKSEASNLGVQLQRRVADPRIKSGMAAFAKSPTTRKQYKDRVRITLREEREEREATRHNTTFEIPLRPAPLLNQCEVLTDAEDARAAVRNPDFTPRPSQGEPHLGFRTWRDDTSATTFKNGGFVANLFAKRRSPVTRNLPVDDEHGIFEVLANDHFSLKGTGSTFVSVVTSLVQLLTYAGKKRGDNDDASLADVRIAVIDLNAPELNTPHKKHYAADVIKRLRDKGEMPWANYRGMCEYLIWGEIPSTAIITTLNLADLERLCRKSPSSANLINLDYLTKQASTRTVCERLKKKNTTLNTRTAAAMGKMAKVFSLNDKKATAAHVEEFVAAQVTGWSITGAPLADKTAIGSLAAAFAVRLGQNADGLSLPKIMVAFVNGVERGVGEMARYSRRPAKV